MLERFFKLTERNTTWQREVSGGATTFMTLSYIIFVQPVVMNAAGMDLESALVATCVASAVATFMMGLVANYPISLAPAMGHNFFFTYVVVLTLGYTWQQALGAIFISGVLFLALSLVGLREQLFHAIPATLKNAIAVGIGLLIAVVGFEWSGMIVDNPGTLVGLGQLSSAPVLLSLFGITVMAILLALEVRAAILLGILATILAGLAAGMLEYEGLVGPIPSITPTLFQLDVWGALQGGMVSIIFIFFFLDLFDTVGTLIGVTQEAGLLKSDGTLPRARWAFLSDAVGTTVGALLGTSTITSYVESATGISVGARTGLANMVTGSLFLVAIFFTPLVRMIAGGMDPGQGLVLYPVVAPALIIVGCYMLRQVKRIDWDNFTEAFPAFLTILIMPMTFSITEGISFGFISYTLLKAVTGRFREVPLLIRVFALLFVLRYLFLSY
ncbi:MAG: NCS2 family permease [Acidobacteriota bacterium]|nr:NCS2 family permease [Acidobacteriota bacterium]